MTRIDLFVIIINVVICITFILGIFIVFKDCFFSYYMKIKMFKRLQARRNAMKEMNWIENHLEQIIAIVLKNKIQSRTFIKIELGIFIVVFLIGIRNVSMISAIFMSFIIMICPYLLLRVKLEVYRRKGSYEGEMLIVEFLNQYRINNYNIYRAIERVIEENKGMKISNKLLYKLLMEIRSTGNKDVIRRATDSFAYGINTNWSRMLANNIRIGVETGINVSLSIEDILIQLRDARTIIEERKRLNSEANRILIFLIPFMYISTIYMSIKYLDIPLNKFMQNQIYTSQGFFLLTIILFLFLLNIVIMEFINNQRFDF
ncbi:hypothetical protein [Anaerovorax odorimutans]|uniref:hypothetical protein n=1 Tax=Anaerovorax odorimutans TaxID=109327 RepID=UPI0003F59F78|nr:hypothetical protein [Anaerovorax odorimutans]